MAPSGELRACSVSEKVKCFQCKAILPVDSDGKILSKERMKVDKELVNLNFEMKELVKQITVVTSCRVKEVTQQKVMEIVRKIDSIIEEAMRSEDFVQGKTELMKGKTTCDKQMVVKYAVPVINNRFKLSKRQEEVNEKVQHIREYSRTYDKKIIENKESKTYEGRVLILGDSQARGLAAVVQQRIGKSFEVTGIVKPSANMEEITNTASASVRSLTKKRCMYCMGRYP